MDPIPLPPECCSDAFLELARSKTLEEFRATVHFTSGMRIRNSLGLWDPKSPAHKWFVTHGVHHADDMSAMLLTALWYRARDQAPDPDVWERQLDRFRRHWQRVDPDGLGRLYGEPRFPPGRS